MKHQKLMTVFSFIPLLNCAVWFMGLYYLHKSNASHKGWVCVKTALIAFGFSLPVWVLWMCLSRYIPTFSTTYAVLEYALIYVIGVVISLGMVFSIKHWM